MQELFPAIGKAIPSLQFAVKKLKITTHLYPNSHFHE